MDFFDLNPTAQNWKVMAATPNGDVYACVYGGSIYKQSRGIGNFVSLGQPVSLGQTSRNWQGMTVSPNGDIYISVFGGNIYESLHIGISTVSTNQGTMGMISPGTGQRYFVKTVWDIDSRTLIPVNVRQEITFT